MWRSLTVFVWVGKMVAVIWNEAAWVVVCEWQATSTQRRIDLTGIKEWTLAVVLCDFM
jgi:hypothetical protein